LATRAKSFDLQGWRVKVVVNHYYAPGYEAVQWDHRDESGAGTRAGVYLYRLTAGPFRAEKKMVLLP
jgi:hypothetical protein